MQGSYRHWNRPIRFHSHDGGAKLVHRGKQTSPPHTTHACRKDHPCTKLKHMGAGLRLLGRVPQRPTRPVEAQL